MSMFGRFNLDDTRGFGHDRSIRFIRGRYLFVYFVVSIVVAIGTAVLILSAHVLAQPSPILKGTLLFVFCSVLLSLLLIASRRTDIEVGDFIPIMPRAWAIRCVATALALFIVSLGTIYAFYLPLSYVFPTYVESRLFGPSTQFFWFGGDQYLLANAISFLTVVVLGPIVEEFFFRGLLLRTWIAKWGVWRAIIFSSLVFALLHADHLGAFLIAAVLSLSYIWTKRLEAPILIHMTFNFTFALYEGGIFIVIGPYEKTIANFQSLWWIGALSLLIGIPLLVKSLQALRPAIASSGARI